MRQNTAKPGTDDLRDAFIPDQGPVSETSYDRGLVALCAIASHYRIAADPKKLTHELAIGGSAQSRDILRAAKIVGLKARLIQTKSAKRISSLPTPAIICSTEGNYGLYLGAASDGIYSVADPVSLLVRHVDISTLLETSEGRFILVQRRFTGPGVSREAFGFRWFLPSLFRYRKAFGHVLVASLFVQIFALITPLFFQVVVDKVLAHRSYSTLIVLVIGLVALGLFDVILQYLRSYTLSHTTNRIDVELGQRLFRHMMNLPLSYFETRAAGQTVARIRELETIRDFLTGQGLFSGLDLIFTAVFIFVLFCYSTTLAWIVVASIPFYIVIGVLIRPFLKERIDEKFDRGAYSQQLLVETVVGIQTLKASAVEPVVSAQWEERLAAYVRSSFTATMLAAKGQNAIQYISKVTSAALLMFGAQSVINGELTVGALVAFNMIASQVSQPILRLSQLWQDFQQVQISVSRLADILNAPTEPRPKTAVNLPPPKGALEFRRVNFRYRSDTPNVLNDINVSIRPGEVVGIVGASGSGKSTLTKLVQRFYMPDSGQVFLDGQDISQTDPIWLRSHIGVVLQENMLFNRTVHDNIAFSNPAMPRDIVVRMARMSGADEFITKLPRGYDTMIEERGANLSGGQRQRIALARALATNPPLLILDEATSALDYESERIILQNMRDIVRGRTVIIIAHRLATVRYCNRIIGMKDGAITEQGTHEELLARPDGTYAHLWKLQSGSVFA
ncbi:type I secretion system permease/ATPase [Agrobacterium sp. O3.4]|uniref:Type I secretion system permease/ATPase n=2 Tax=Rhizobium/Agrobacterium group TaxID=227290 RepID=A0A546XE35_RHIRH|nr:MULTISPECIES: type I secretion system permease/ATPase [Rhizobium/Agrobacterium group]MCZ7470016.1 type I secretion system permease/ATPase [Rhizobium rhizogenes]TRA99015.1 type I secretion system permease/ATPase [Rhizobium rhizogenes]WHO11292.1 type I secretion system permease/ATPase [Agrobacterium cucumeris]